MVRKIIFGLIGVLFSTSLYAGSAIIPQWMKSPTGGFCLTVSNINNTSANVTITLYQKNGTPYTGTYITYDVLKLNQSFVLNGNASGMLCITDVPGDFDYGYGLIKGEPTTNNGTVQLAAFASFTDLVDHNRRFAIPINAGLPF
jgi:ribonuclease BN (tRNA processing enzyme)